MVAYKIHSHGAESHYDLAISNGWFFLASPPIQHASDIWKVRKETGHGTDLSTAHFARTAPASQVKDLEVSIAAPAAQMAVRTQCSILAAWRFKAVRIFWWSFWRFPNPCPNEIPNEIPKNPGDDWKNRSTFGFADVLAGQSATSPVFKNSSNEPDFLNRWTLQDCDGSLGVTAVWMAQGAQRGQQVFGPEGFAFSSPTHDAIIIGKSSPFLGTNPVYLSNLVSEITIPSVFVSHRFFDRMNFSAIRINAAGLFLWSSEAATTWISQRCFSWFDSCALSLECTKWPDRIIESGMYDTLDLEPSLCCVCISEVGSIGVRPGGGGMLANIASKCSPAGAITGVESFASSLGFRCHLQ